jgi:hypothetical protein
LPPNAIIRYIKDKGLKLMTRKEFVQTAGRVTILTAMTLMVGAFIRQRKLSLSGDCPSDLACRGCNRLGGCTLPKAMKQKEYEKG